MIKVSYQQIIDNLSQLSRHNYLVLKSNAYGFGFEKIYQIAENLGFYRYAVITLDDAVYIKEKNPQNRVLLMGVFKESKIDIYQKYDIEITINHFKEIEKIRHHPIKVQIAINTGMNRFGINPFELESLFKVIDNSNLLVTGIYSHSAREFDTEYKIFDELTSKYLLEKHFAASYKKTKDHRRIGVEIYENALKVYGQIIKINYVKKGEYVGYGYHYQMNADGYIGIIDMGYADGLERKCNGFKVFIKDTFYELAGYACMNHTFVLLPNDTFLDDEVEFVGENNSIDNYVNFFDTIKHQIYTSFLKKD